MIQNTLEYSFIIRRSNVHEHLVNHMIKALQEHITFLKKGDVPRTGHQDLSNGNVIFWSNKGQKEVE